MRFFIFVGLLVLIGCSVERKARKAFERGEYQNVINTLTSKKTADAGKANYLIAESYRLSNRIKLAEPFYAKAGGRGIDRDTVQFYYAQALKANQKYDEALKQLDELIKRTANEALRNRAQMEYNALTYLEKLREKPSYYRVKNLETVNTQYSEYNPVFLNNE